ncbi:glycosyltransferase [Roseomonas nepalensis]|uniref:Glycosyltransferase n=1 Tax=Muricoccus nepalensis TaxID=1854500 RepID=A0A502ES24_9PROT|nr:glycosyltransferase [Roseomonas nepalensis]TPG39914.1 glycosyltransferase [Roseomonas nepalensis]
MFAGVKTFLQIGDKARDACDWYRARDAYKRALDKDPSLAHIWVQYGHALKESGDYQEAVAAYKQAIKLRPGDADAHVQLGHVLKLMGQSSEAAAAYRRALEVEPECDEAQRELVHLGEIAGSPMLISTGTAAVHHIAFDVSDLLQYFMAARLPTGIQRVQIEVIRNFAEQPSVDFDFSIVCFTKQTDFWLDIPVSLFQKLCRLAVSGGETDAPEWQAVCAELHRAIDTGRPAAFPQGAYILNLGTSWWLQNYFLNLRSAKARFGVRYVPFVHDCIPIMTPEHCVTELTRDFISWITGAFQHADHILVNSNATAADVAKVAAVLGHKIEDPVVVPLDADYRRANSEVLRDSGAAVAEQLLSAHDLLGKPFVLFVSTIESRKNHLLAFSAWLTLIKRHGSQKVPKLVCVGNHGWLNDAIHAKLIASSLLRERVVMLSKISDAELEGLYRNCLFTLYPSSYEGWGLPVTESLCYGKVPIVANVSSLPEAGGDFAEYIDPSSERELVSAAERLLFDEEYRAVREEKIAREFQPRPWSAVAKQIVAQIRAWALESESAAPPRQAEYAKTAKVWPYEIVPGRYYSLAENTETNIWPGMVPGEILRQGDAWWWPEPWGCWTKPRPARLAMLVELPSEESALIFLGIRGVQGVPSTVTITIEGAGNRRSWIEADQTKWLLVRLPPTSSGKRLIQITVRADKSTDFREGTKGADHRIASLGVLGVMVCAETDTASRLRFLECVTFGDMSEAMGVPPVRTEYFVHAQ